MHCFKTLLAGAALVALSALAQEILAFTTFPSNIIAGTPITLTWAGGDPTEPVTITLHKGQRSNLKNVAVLTTSGTGGTFTWTPEEDIVNGLDYAFMISQGEQVSYTDLFSISGGVDAPASSAISSNITLSSVTSSSARSTAPSATESETSSPSSAEIESGSDTDEGGRLTSGGKAGLGAGMAVFGIICLIFALVWWRRIRQRRKNPEDQKHYGLGGVASASGEPAVELPAKSAAPELDPTRQFNELDTCQRHELDDREIGATVQVVPGPGLEFYELDISPALPREVIESENTTAAEVAADQDVYALELQQLQEEEEILKKKKADLLARQDRKSKG